MHRFLFLPLLLVVACDGCKKKIETDPRGEPTEAPVEKTEVKKEAPAPVAEMMKNFNRVFFDFDAATLSAEGKASLDANAAIMSEYSDIKLEIQGHADERGTTDYNLALGQKRADAVVQYLLARGISSSRVKSVSYGEERPLDGQSTERAWSSNRRAEFVITWSGDAPVKGSAN
ncbi:MAG: peptidoglycan-associated lipoprotein Pal [Pseudomonadota bacterium]|nr:peptidoglycan-associated lipoprotein Pal [Pseudomonadota bacterium]